VKFGEEEIEKPTFTNEVVIIRPQIFYENEEAHKDNKFMKYSGMEKSDTNAEVIKLTKDLCCIRLKQSLITSRLLWNPLESRCTNSRILTTEPLTLFFQIGSRHIKTMIFQKGFSFYTL
jgi:hypothetical protein